MNHRAEAEKAITHAIKTLSEPDPSPLTLRLTVAALEHALSELALLVEVKRVRRPAGTA